MNGVVPAPGEQVPAWVSNKAESAGVIVASDEGLFPDPSAGPEDSGVGQSIPEWAFMIRVLEIGRAHV